ncbi:hypothetical protein Gorai_023350 [Gossypium raimondii]|uniref:Uncharacterized protein n=1 Tax=Gossypium raimondii TaxID=29730 RepID=A0A7J8NVV8_GOSRA|nr:hypothetical protein [Gossypium raimondii]
MQGSVFSFFFHLLLQVQP